MKKKDIYVCSFCGKDQHEVKKIIAGPPPADICDECVDLCVDIICGEGDFDSLPTIRKLLNKKPLDFDELGLSPKFNKRKFERMDGHCFYLCPFSEPFNTVYSEHVVPAVKELGHTISRADEIFGTQPIIEDIWEGINTAEIILADVTGRNPNVMYEIGMAHTVGKPVIIITQTIDDVPFDLKHFRCIVYTYTPKGIKSLEERITGTLRFVKSGKA